MFRVIIAGGRDFQNYAYLKQTRRKQKRKRRRKMKVFWCCFVKDDDWGSFVIAESRSKSKALFLHSFRDCGECIDVRCRKIKDIPKDVAIEPGCLDLPDDPILTKLGLKYQESEI